MATLRKRELLWQDVSPCLLHGANEISKLEQKYHIEGSKGLDQSKVKQYSELFNLSIKEMNEVFGRGRVHKTDSGVQVRKAIAAELVLDSTMLRSKAQQSVMMQIRHERPGLVMLKFARPVKSQHGRLDALQKNKIHELREHLQRQREDRELFRFAVVVANTCHQMGSSFLLPLLLCAGGAWRPCGFQKLTAADDIFTYQDSRGWRGSFVTNNPAIFQVKNSNQRSASDDPASLGQVLGSYAKGAHLATTDLQYMNLNDAVTEDQVKDYNYFGPEENNDWANYDEQEKITIENAQEILAEEVETIDGPEPKDFGITDDMINKEGDYELRPGEWVQVRHRADRLARPGEDAAYPNYPWRSSWTRTGNGVWRQEEDEVRWEELHRPDRDLPETAEILVTIFKQRIDARAGARLRRFPGMQKITLEKMVRRAHEGLGHPELQRFLRILRHSGADPEVVEIAKKMRCSVCEAYRLPDPARRSAPPREEFFVNDLVGADTVHLRDHKRRNIPALNIIDWHTHFQLVIPMAAETAQEARKAYRQWVRFFGPPRKVLVDLGQEFKAEFKLALENDGSEALPSSLETPTQRGLTERAGGVFKNILYKAMMDHECSTNEEWRELVDVTCMMKNRLLLRAGYSPIQRVIGYNPRLPGGLLSGGQQDEAVASKFAVGDRDVARAIKMRKAAAMAFHEADCDQALRALGGRRKHHEFEVGQAVYFWRRGSGSVKNERNSYWQGPGRVLMTSLPNAVWIAFNGAIVKAAPERVRVATEEESLSVSGWMDGITHARQAFEKKPNRNFLDLTKDLDPIEEDEAEPEEIEAGEPPLRRVRQKTSDYARYQPPPANQELATEETELPTMSRPPGIPDGDLPGVPAPSEAPEIPLEDRSGPAKRDGTELDEPPPGKRSRLEWLEIYNMTLQALAKQRQKKEVTIKDFVGPDIKKLERAMLKEINNNLTTGAYEFLDRKLSREILATKPDKVMESRYVLTKKPLEPSDVPAALADGLLLEGDSELGPCKAKCRHVMKGYSEEAALDVESTTPQVSRDSVIFVTQVLASMGWDPGFLDFTQAFHSGDPIKRELYCKQPKEGIPGAHPEQLIRLLKTCYGLTDGPFAWYSHLAKRLQEKYGYKQSKADPCVFLLHAGGRHGSGNLRGIIGVATDDLLHGGDQQHWENIADIAREYKLGKNQKGCGRFTGKDVRKEEDGSITLNQAFYVDTKVIQIPLTKKRKQQRYAKCDDKEIEQLRSQLGALSWLAKETRCDLAGRVALLQQAFPTPKVMDLIEGNKIAAEAKKYKHLGIKVTPIPWKELRVSVVTDAAWGNAKDSI